MVGCPIRNPPDQSLFAAPRSISVLTPPFIALPNQVILHKPFVALPKYLILSRFIVVLLLLVVVKEHVRCLQSAEDS